MNGLGSIFTGPGGENNRRGTGNHIAPGVNSGTRRSTTFLIGDQAPPTIRFEPGSAL